MGVSKLLRNSQSIMVYACITALVPVGVGIRNNGNLQSEMLDKKQNQINNELSEESSSSDTPIESQTGLGIIANTTDHEDIVHNIPHRETREYTILLAPIVDVNTDFSTVAGRQSTDITVLPPSQTVKEARNSLIKYAESIPLSSLILQNTVAPQIAHTQSSEQLTADSSSAETEVINLTEESEQTTVAAIIPAYNESESICGVIQSTSQYVDEVIVINDSSTDNTEKLAKEFADSIISHPKNMGVGGAVHTGYLAAVHSEHDIVVQIDADGQHDPSYIPKMVERIRERGADMVIGSRWLNESYQQYSLVRRLGIRFFTSEVNIIAGINITDVTSGFRAYRTSKLEMLSRPANSHWAVEQTLEAAREGWKIEEISVPMPPAVEGSQFDLETLLKYPLRMIFTTLKVLLFR